MGWSVHEQSLGEIRRFLGIKQGTLAERLGMDQGELSKLERRPEVYVGTIRKYIEAPGGTLDLIATFPDATAIRISNLSSARD
jgi:hypothetical protein